MRREGSHVGSQVRNFAKFGGGDGKLYGSADAFPGEFVP